MWTYRALIDGVHDGDTIHARIDLGFNTWQQSWVRLRDCYAPELGSVKAPIPAGIAALNGVLSLLKLNRAEMTESRGYFGQHGDLWVKPGGEIPMLIRTVMGDETEKYGRVLGTVWPGEWKDVPLTPPLNAVMVAAGWATVTA